MGNFSSLKEMYLTKITGNIPDFADLDLMIAAEEETYTDIGKSLVCIRNALERTGRPDDRSVVSSMRRVWRERISQADREKLADCHDVHSPDRYRMDAVDEGLPGNTDIRAAVFYMMIFNRFDEKTVDEACAYIRLYSECCGQVHVRESAPTGIDIAGMEHLKLMFRLIQKKYSRFGIPFMKLSVERIPVDGWEHVEAFADNRADNDGNAVILKSLYERKNDSGTVEYATISLFKLSDKTEHEHRALEILRRDEARVDCISKSEKVSGAYGESVLITRIYPARPRALKYFENEPLAERIKIARAVAAALNEIHKSGICHRGLANDGILIYTNRRGEIKVSFLNYDHAKIPPEKNVRQVMTEWEQVVSNNSMAAEPAPEAAGFGKDTPLEEWVRYDIYHLANILKDFIMSGSDSNKADDDLSVLFELAGSPEPVHRPSLDDIVGQLDECIGRSD